MNPSNTPAPAAPQAAQADLLGDATPLQPPSAPVPFSGNRDAEDEKNKATPLQPVQDENQPGFIGERNLPRA